MLTVSDFLSANVKSVLLYGAEAWWTTNKKIFIKKKQVPKTYKETIRRSCAWVGHMLQKYSSKCFQTSPHLDSLKASGKEDNHAVLDAETCRWTSRDWATHVKENALC